MGTANRITYADIARAAKVDKSTVSLALSGHPRISERTRERVRRAAAKLGYVPDPALSSLAAQRWRGRRDRKGVVLAFVCDNARDAEPELMAYLDGVRTQAGLLGYGVEVFSLSDYPSATALLRVIAERGLRGVVIGQSRRDLPAELFAEDGPPRVHCGFLRNVPCDTVRPDLGAAVNLAWQRLGGAGVAGGGEGGRKRVVFCLEVERGLHSDQVILGAARALSEAEGRNGPPVLVGWSEAAGEAVRGWGAKAGRDVGGAVFDKLAERVRTKPVDAVVVLNALHRERLRRMAALPDGVPVVPLHLRPGARAVPGVDLRLEDVGRVAVNLLELKMRRVPLASAGFRQTVEIEPRWESGGLAP